MIIIRTLLFVCLSFSVAFAADLKFEKVNDDVRERYLSQAQVWHDVDIASMDLMAGSKLRTSFPFNSEVKCTYVDPKSPMTGASPKFLCKLKSGEVVRIKYGKDSRETYSEVAATRLMWALGFYTDDVYPVKVRCLKCPADPSHPAKKEKRTTKYFDHAAIELNFNGEAIEDEDEGWKWTELESVDPKKGGAPEAHVDALKLLMVFIQHGDNKPEQQRLACLPDDIINAKGVGVCKRPVLMVQDLGATFGAANEISNEGTKMNFDGWKDKGIWNDYKEKQFFVEHKKNICYGNLVNSKAAGEEGLKDPRISEGGRKFLAQLLTKLSDQQILDLFRVARVQNLGHSPEEWAAAFKEKRKQIAERSCE